MMRNLGALVAGVVVTFLAIFLVGMIGNLLFPISGEVNLRDPAANQTLITAAPIGAQLFGAGAWFAGALTGGLVAGRISGRHWTVWTISALVILLALGNIFMIPHPTWMQIAAVAVPLIGGFIASRLTPDRSTRVEGPADAV